MTTDADIRDPPLSIFLAKQPVVELPVLLDELEAEPPVPSFLQLATGIMGKDITQPIPMPVAMCEPSSDMVKRAEDLEYTELLDEAAEFPKGSIQRLLKVVAYAVSPYATCHADRIGKPLFVIPGETFEAVYPKKGVRYIGEAIQDNGWASVGHAEGRYWQMNADDQLKPRFGPNSLEFVPRWFVEVVFEDGDLYTWKKVSTVANQTVTNPVFVSHHGQLRIVQVSENRTGVVNFAAIPKTTLATKSRKAANRPIEGYVEEAGKKVDGFHLSGFWDSHLDVVLGKKSSQRLWTKNPLPPGLNRFQMPAFTVGLCKSPKEVIEKLPPTDTRWRKDTRLVELGKWKEAAEEKARLEVRGRAEAKKAKENSNILQPRWFNAASNRKELGPGEGIRWRYNGRYWASKEEEFADVELPELFG